MKDRTVFFWCAIAMLIIVLVLSMAFNQYLKKSHYDKQPLEEISITIHKISPLQFQLNGCPGREHGKLQLYLDCHAEIMAKMYREDM